MSSSHPPGNSPGAATAANPFRATEREASVRSRTPTSLELYRRASVSLAGGVASGLRRNARPYPMYYESGSGAVIRDVDGNEFLDYTLAWGPLILGHSPPAVAHAVAEQLGRGLTYGAQHRLEFEVAERLCKAIPCADSVCFANSGTEIVQLALRLSRAATGRRKFIKFEGHYHGWADSVLVSYHPSQVQADTRRPVGAGDGQLPHENVIIAEWNNTASVEEAFHTHRDQISALICEPLVCNSSCLPPDPGFLEFLREITTRYSALLIFDEVITGFRIALGGAQEFYGVTPDLATYAKAIGAGAPLSVLAGRQQFMDLIATGKVVHAGTLNGNPLSLAAAKAAIDVLAAGNGAAYTELRRNGEALRRGLENLLSSAGLPVATNGEGPVFHISFADRPPRTYRDTLQADNALYSDFALALLSEGILVLPDGRWYLSTAHTPAAIEATLAAAARCLN